MRITNLTEDSTEFTSNAFLVEGEDDAGDTLVDAGNDGVVVERLSERGGVDAVVLTHTHGDHIGSLPEVVERFDVPVYAYDGSRDDVDHGLDDGGSVGVGGEVFEVWHTPGHKDDHVCLYSRETGVLFAGDLVFAGGSFGRTDLAEGDRGVLVESIERVLNRADAISEMHTGHGPSVTEDARKHVEASLRNAKRY